MAASALAKSLLRRCTLMSARSAVAPLSEPAMFCSSSMAASPLPPARWVIASAVRFLASSGSSLSALAKYSSAFFESPFCRCTSPASVYSAGGKPSLPVAAFSSANALAGWPERR